MPLLQHDLWMLILEHADAVECANAECAGRVTRMGHHEWIQAVRREANKHMDLPFNVFFLPTRELAKQHALRLPAAIRRTAPTDGTLLVQVLCDIVDTPRKGVASFLQRMTRDPHLLLAADSSLYWPQEFWCSSRDRPLDPMLVLYDDPAVRAVIRERGLEALCWFEGNGDPVRYIGLLELLKTLSKEGDREATLDTSRQRLAQGCAAIVDQLEKW